MLGKLLTSLSLSVWLVACGTTPSPLIVDETAFRKDLRQSAGNAALAGSLREAKPLVDLGIGER